MITMRRLGIIGLLIVSAAIPAWAGSSLSDSKASLGLGSVENTAISTWAGSANVTTLGTITTGTWGATDVALTAGGTNATLTAANGGIVYSTATAMAITAAGSAGQHIQSGGAGAPTWTTATFPATATTTGTILRADGTNWVATSATYPTTTVENQLLYSSATNTIAGIATASNAVLITGAAGVPSLGTDLPTAVTIGSGYIYRGAGTDVPLTDGGTGASDAATARTNLGIGLVENTALSTWAGSSNITTIGTLTKLTAADSTLDTTGDELLDLSGTIGANGGTERGINLALTNSNVTTANIVNGLDIRITDNVALANIIAGASASISSSGTPASGTAKHYGGYFEGQATGIANGNVDAFGAKVMGVAKGAGGSTGTFNSFGLYIADGVGNTNGTSTNTGLYVESITGADTNFAAYFAGGTVYSAGAVLVNGTAAYGVEGEKLELNGGGTAAATDRGGLSLNNWQAAVNSSVLNFRKTRGGAVGTNTIVQNGDLLGQIIFSGGDGTNFDTAAFIGVEVDGEPSAGTDMPGRITFNTTPDGSGSPSQRMRISAGGTVYVNNNLYAGHDGVDITNNGAVYCYAPDNVSPALYARINATQANLTASDVFASFNSTENTEGSIAGTATPGLIAYNTFTGSHWAQSDSIAKKPIKRKSQTLGTEIDAYDATLEPGTVLVSTDQIADIEGKTYLPKVVVSYKPGDKAVYGTYGGHDNKGQIIVLAVGSGVVLVTDESGPIEPGDMLCTSSTPGYAMKCPMPVDISIVGFKARQSLKRGKGRIACTYLAG